MPRAIARAVATAACVGTALLGLEVLDVASLPGC
jgi:hypothetical protein